MKKTIDSHGAFGCIALIKNLLFTKLFFPSARLIRKPFRCRGRQYINLGIRLTTGTNCRFEAYPLYKQECLKFGDDVQVNDSVHIAAIHSVNIGHRVLIASNVFITDHNHGSYGIRGVNTSPLVSPIERELSSSPVFICDDVWIGEYVVILPGVTVGKGAVIGSMSVVTKSIPEYSVAVGSPARVIKCYDFEQQKWVKT